MTPVIQQRVRFRTSPRALFDLYLDSRRHSLSTGAPATISRKSGEKFKAFGGQLEGRNLLIVPGKQIVQLWRATHWKKADWSILILTFSAVAGGAQVDLVHVGVPAYDHGGVSKGWPQYYWHPWKKYLRKSAAS
jgi:activator of HSP90 ATPase